MLFYCRIMRVNICKGQKMRDDKKQIEFKELGDALLAGDTRLKELQTEFDSCLRRMGEAIQDLLDPSLSPEMLKHMKVRVNMLRQELSIHGQNIEHERIQLTLLDQQLEQHIQQLPALTSFVGIASSNPDDVNRILSSMSLLTTRSRLTEDSKNNETETSGMRKS